MATTLLQQSQHHFGQLSNSYNSGVYRSYSGQPSPDTNLESNLTGASNSEQQLSYSSPSTWNSQPALHRRTSRSPNVKDRTPIRHNRPDMSRHRSSSRPEMFMTYAQEQTRQVQPNLSRNLYMPSAPVDTTGQTYQTHHYAFHPSTSPYMAQQPYFGAANPQQNYTQLAPQQTSPNPSNMYPPSQPDLPLAQVAGTSLNPTDTMYGQPRTSQLPLMSSVPSSFPPIPQPLESTPNEIDVAGSRQKPQCWDHGCNGRQFSTFSNLLRHQREKSGTATKARCPHCGTEFTRTTARNGHLYGGKCKGIPEDGKDESKAEIDEKDDLP